MNENKPVSEEIIRDVKDESSEIIDEMREEIENEVFQVVEDTIQDVEKGSAEESVDDFALPAKAKKQVRTKLLVEKVKNIVDESNKQIDACRHMLELDLKKYEDARTALRKGGLDASISWLKTLRYQMKEDELPKEVRVVFEAKETLKPIVFKAIPSGRLSAFIYALIGGFAAAGGMVYLATEKLGIPLNITKIPSENVIQSILAWFSTLLGLHEDVYLGAGVLGFTVVLVMTLIYMIRIDMKARCNLHLAVKQFVEAQMYTEERSHCKAKMEKIDAHINDAIDTLKTYEIILNEQQGKLQRVHYIEGKKEKSIEYHYKSFKEMHDTYELIHTIKDFMAIPMSQEGELSSKSVLYLQNAKDRIDKFLGRFY